MMIAVGHWDAPISAIETALLQQCTAGMRESSVYFKQKLGKFGCIGQ